MAQRAHDIETKAKREAESDQHSRRTDGEKERLPDITMAGSERVEFVPEYDEESIDDSPTPVEEKDGAIDSRDLGGEFLLCIHAPSLDAVTVWERGLGVKIDMPAVVEILLKQIRPDSKHHENMLYNVSLTGIAKTTRYSSPQRCIGLLNSS